MNIKEVNMKLRKAKKMLVYLPEDLIKEAKELCREIDVEFADFIVTAIEKYIESIVEK